MSAASRKPESSTCLSPTVDKTDLPLCLLLGAITDCLRCSLYTPKAPDPFEERDATGVEGGMYI
jgi:hypothetical protein